MSVGTLLLSLCFLLLPVNATITILDSGKRFASREDKYYGPLFWKGYQYMARLQYINENFSLCPSENNKTQSLQLPVDNLPVALLVRSGGCSLREKVEYVKKFIKQSELVNFLIVDGSSYTEELTTADSNNNNNNNEEYSYSVGDDNKNEMMELMKQGHVTVDNGAADSFLTLDAGDFLGKRHKHRDQVTVPMHILHVGSRTHYQLLELLAHQSNASYQSGGIRISMDSRTNTMDSSTALWIAFSSLLGACCCSFCLILSGTRNNFWVEPQPPQQQQNTRPQRRRLNKEQVKRLFPIYQFNGESLDPLEDAPLVNSQENKDESDEEKNDGLQPFVPQPHELTMCSICLEDFVPGDRLRCLSCNHVFCARCIGRWLVERSATCPLCKLEIYDPEEEVEEEEEDDEEAEDQAAGENEQDEEAQNAANDENTGITRVPSRFFRVFNTGSVSHADEEAPAEEETEQLIEESSPTPLELADNASTVVVEQRRSWWRRTFRRIFSPSASRESRIENMEGATVSLTQPLLSNNAQEPNNMMVVLESTMSNAQSQSGEDVLSAALAPPSATSTESDEEQQQSVPDVVSEGETSPAPAQLVTV